MNPCRDRGDREPSDSPAPVSPMNSTNPEYVEFTSPDMPMMGECPSTAPTLAMLVTKATMAAVALAFGEGEALAC